MAYYLVERDAKSMGQRRESLKLSVYTKGLPSCCGDGGCCCSLSNMLQRAKHLMCSGNMLVIFVYHILVRGIVTALSCISLLLLGYFVALIFVPIAFEIDDSLFDDNNICPFGTKACSARNLNECDCNVMAIDDIGTAIGFALFALLWLPIVFRISNVSAEIVKTSTYYFYSYYYSDDGLEDRRTLLEQNENDRETKGNGNDANVVNL